MPILAGTVRNIFTGNPVANAKITYNKKLKATTNAEGSFSIAGATSTRVSPLSIVAPGYYPRSTFASGTHDEWHLIPGSFSITAFNEVARRNGRTMPWIINPKIYIDLRPHGFNPPAGMVNTWADEVEAQLPGFVEGWSNGWVQVASFERGTNPPPNNTPPYIVIHFSEKDADYNNGAYIGYAYWKINSISEMIAGTIYMRYFKYRSDSAANKRKGILCHELGHCMGYGHASIATSVMQPSIGSRTDLLAWDHQMARIAYGRWPGNKTQDVDVNYNGKASWWDEFVSIFQQTEFEPV